MTIYSPPKQITILELKDIPLEVTILDLYGCGDLETLPESLPSTITKIICYGCKKLRNFPKLHEGVEVVDISWCGNLKTFPNLPSTVTKFILRGHQELNTAPKLHEGLEVLDVSWCGNLEILPESLPSTITEIMCYRCEKLRNFPKLHEGVEVVDFSWCENLETLPESLPSTITKIICYGCKKLGNFPKLHEGLEVVDFSGYKNFKTLPNIPSTVTKLILSGCSALKTIPKLHEGLKVVDFSGCKDLEDLPENLPSTITDIMCSGCEKLRNFPKLHEGLEVVDFSGYKNFKTLPNIPSTVTKLILSGCSELKTLPKLHEGLKVLNVSGCKDLEDLPENLPSTITFLDLSGCDNLRNTPALIAQLEELEYRNRNNPDFILMWPEHIDRNFTVTQIKGNIAKAYEKYYAEDKFLKDKKPNASISHREFYPVLHLFHRYMSESVVERGGIDKLVASLVPLSQDIMLNPAMLKSLNDVASDYLEACVNQPVAGMSDLALLVNIHLAPDIISKLECARALMVLHLVRDRVRDFKVSAVEAELANAMYREVYLRLKAEGDLTQDWQGIPDGVAYERIVKKLLTDTNIDRIYEEAKQVLAQPLEKVADYLFEWQFAELWARNVIDKADMAEMEEPVEAVRAKFMQLYDEESIDVDSEELMEVDVKESMELDREKAKKKISDELKRISKDQKTIMLEVARVLTTEAIEERRSKGGIPPSRCDPQEDESGRLSSNDHQKTTNL